MHNSKYKPIPFVYTSGGCLVDSPLRGEDGLEILALRLEAECKGGEKRRRTRESNAGVFRTFENIIEREGLIIARAFVQRLTRGEFLGSGSEHEVFSNVETGRVIKITHPDEIGDGGLVGKGDVMDYFSALCLSKVFFSNGTRFEGVVYGEGLTPRIVTSQPLFRGRNAREYEIREDLRRKGFTPVRAGDNLWENRTYNVSVSDAVSENVIKGAGGLHYFDVDVIPRRGVGEIIRKVKAGGKDRAGCSLPGRMGDIPETRRIVRGGGQGQVRQP